MSEVLGKKVVHVDIPSAELERLLESTGIPAEYARMLSAMDTAIKHGSEDRVNDVVLTVTGRQPGTFRQYAESVKDVWQ